MAEEEPKVKAQMTYAVELECNEPDTRHYRHPWCYQKNHGKLALRPPLLAESDPAIIPVLFEKAAEKYKDNPCMGTRNVTECTIEGKKMYWKKADLKYKTYGQVYADASWVAQGLIALPGVKELRQSDKCVAAILAETSAGWQICAQAAFQLGLPVTTVYTTLGHDAMCYGLNQTEATIIFMDWGEYDKLSAKVLNKCPALRHIVLIGRCFVPQNTVGGETKAFPSNEEAANFPKIGEASTTTLSALMDLGKENQVNLAEFQPKEDSLSFIMYTSGSTGQPKGVMLTHRNFVSLIASVLAQGTVYPSPKDTFIAFLPLAHILELMVETVCLVTGAHIAYGHPRTLTSQSPYMHPSNQEGSDLLASRPTLMVAVPAILDLIKTNLSRTLEKMEGTKGKLVRAAVGKAQGLDHGESGWLNLLVSLPIGIKGMVLGTVKKKLGLEQLRCICSGGAPLSAQTQTFAQAVLAPVAQGYGATETTGCATVQECIASGGRPADTSSGMVGACQPSCELKLLSVPDMGYLVTDEPPRGEILVAGNTVSQQGYFKMPEKTAEDFPKHSDGKIWFHTGDIGVMTANGTLKIVDRKKDLVKLLAGEYVSLGKVEASLKQVAGIGAVCVFAKSDKDHCVAIVSQPERGWGSVGGKPEEAKLVPDIEQTLRKLGFARFEIPTKARVDDEQWTPESGLVTASLKIQRNPLRKKYNQPGGLLESMDYRFPE